MYSSQFLATPHRWHFLLAHIKHPIAINLPQKMGIYDLHGRNIPHDLKVQPRAAASVRWILPLAAKYSPWLPADGSALQYVLQGPPDPKNGSRVLVATAPVSFPEKQPASCKLRLRVAQQLCKRLGFHHGMGEEIPPRPRPNSIFDFNPSFFTTVYSCNPTDDRFLAWKYWWYSIPFWVIFVVVVVVVVVVIVVVVVVVVLVAAAAAAAAAVAAAAVVVAVLLWLSLLMLLLLWWW